MKRFSARSTTTTSRIQTQQQAYQATKAMCQNYSLPAQSFENPLVQARTADSPSTIIEVSERLESSVPATISSSSLCPTRRSNLNDNMSLQVDFQGNSNLHMMVDARQHHHHRNIMNQNTMTEQETPQISDAMTDLERYCMEYARSVIERNSLNSELMNRKMPSTSAAAAAGAQPIHSKNAEWNLRSSSQVNTAMAFDAKPYASACSNSTAISHNDMEVEEHGALCFPTSRRVSFTNLKPTHTLDTGSSLLKRKFMWNQ